MTYFSVGDRAQHSQLGVGTVASASDLTLDEGQHVEVELDSGAGWHGHSMFLDRAEAFDARVAREPGCTLAHDGVTNQDREVEL